MKIDEGMFAIKLYELGQQYGQLQSRLLVCQNGGHEKIKRELLQVTDECVESDLLLESRVNSSRSPAVAELAKAQREYIQKTEAILEKIPGYINGEGDKSDGKVEAAALYAEYAIDFATQSMRHGLLAALKAIDMQLTEEEQEN